MISFDLQNLKSLKGIGVEVAGIGITLNADPKAVRDLPLPFHSPVPGAGETGLLSWHANLSEFYGRDTEMALLDDWAKEDQYRCWVKFITADGGFGKSRLAAEFAKKLRDRGWSAGFLNLSDPQAFPLGKLGTLIIVDYPEENRDGVKALFEDLASVDWPSKIRVLLVTRGNVGDWDDAIQSGNAHPIVDRRPISLRPIAEKDLFRQFESALANAKKCLNSSASPLSEEAFSAWLELDPGINRRPLFVIALALYSTLNPYDDVVRYSGKKVVRALAQREIDRLVRIAEGQKLENKYVWAQLLAMANIADSISIVDTEKFAGDKTLDLSLPTGRKLREILANSTILADERVPAMKPDIVAATFTVEALARASDTAPELIWAAMQNDINGNFNRLGRLAYDSEYTLGTLNNRLGVSFAKALERRADRAELMDSNLIFEHTPVSMRQAALVSVQSLLFNSNDDPERARLLNNLSACYSELGEREKALEAIQEAVKIRRRLAKGSPHAFEPKLAVSLINQSNCFSRLGEHEKALAAMKEAVEFYRRLAKENPQAFEPFLATVLNNQPVFYRYLGKHREALDGIQEAVEIRRRLAKMNPPAYESELAHSLNNQSNCLSALAEHENALDAIREAAEIYRRLAKGNPQVFEPYLATILNNQSTCYSALSQRGKALEMIEEAVEIGRRLAEADIQAFGIGLSRSLWVFGDLLVDDARHPEAKARLQEGIDVIRPFVDQYPKSEAADILNGLTESLRNISEQ